jgi:hypothetical protein
VRPAQPAWPDFLRHEFTIPNLQTRSR